MALLAAIAILAVLALILSERASPVVALVIVPVAAALIAGQGLATSKLMVSGITSVAPVTAMFVFSILFFGVMSDAGVLAPVIERVLRAVGNRPTRITLGTAALALLVHLDGSGAVCFLVVIPALRPLYEQLGMDRRVLACVTSLAAGVNFLPWTGPTLRAAASLHVPVQALFRPLLVVQGVGLVYVFASAYWLGWRESRRLLHSPQESGAIEAHATGPVAVPVGMLRHGLNALLMIAVLGSMTAGVVDPAAGFMVGTVVALALNYPNSKAQRLSIEAHATTALLMASTLMAAGVFTGIMTGSGMLGALAHAIVAWLPSDAGLHIPVVLGFFSMPLSFLFDPDSYYFGVLPVLAEITRHAGGQPIAVGQASLLGVMTTGFPVSPLTPATFLVTGLSGISLASHQKFTAPWLCVASVVMTIAAVAVGVLAL